MSPRASAPLSKLPYAVLEAKLKVPDHTRNEPSLSYVESLGYGLGCFSLINDGIHLIQSNFLIVLVLCVMTVALHFILYFAGTATP